MKKIATLVFTISLFTATCSLANITKPSIKNLIIVADSIDLAEYVGKYKLPEGSPVESVTFLVKEGKLIGQAGEYPETTLSPKTKDIFEDSNMGGIFTFSRTDGKVKKLKIEVQGMELLAEKVEEGK
jgi:hypothetical protein